MATTQGVVRSVSLKTRLGLVLPSRVVSVVRQTRQALQTIVRRPERMMVGGSELCLVNRKQFINRLSSEELVCFLECLPQVSCLVDIGANVGFFTQLGLANGLRVVAVEPNSQMLSQLMAGVTSSGLRPLSFVVLHAAVSDASGIGVLHGEGQSSSLDPLWSGDSDRYPREIVPLLTAHQVAGIAGTATSRCLIKVDVEGHEEPVIRGFLDAFLTQGWSAPVFIFEHGRPVAPVCQATDPLIRSLIDNGYEVIPIKENVELDAPEKTCVGLSSEMSADGSEFNFLALPEGFGEFGVRVGGHRVPLQGFRTLRGN